jgi:hypothetical protein
VTETSKGKIIQRHKLEHKKLRYKLFVDPNMKSVDTALPVYN